MQKHPKDFGKLGKVVWRRIEQPTFPMRMRAMCNQVKSILLTSAHDPYLPQTSALLETGLAPVSNEETWKNWWEGNSIPQSTQIRACDNISPGARYWLEFSENGNPIQRHMLALDSKSIELARDEEWWRHNFDAQKRSLDSLKRIWSTFTKSKCEPSNSPLSFERQSLEKNLPAPSLRYASEDEKLSLVIADSNPYRYEFSKATRMQYVDSEKFGLFRFLESLLYESRLQPLWLRDIWILDMATLITLMSTDLLETPEHDAPGLGYFANQHFFWKTLFWGRIDSLDFYWERIHGAFMPLLPGGEVLNSDSRLEMLKLVYSIRERYYELMGKIGIGFDDVGYIAAPVSAPVR
ncbi:MAG: hypothetical protein Q8K61_12605 [Gallionella sp.]|nr:hypothetical protein [Gallionella sp.]